MAPLAAAAGKPGEGDRNVPLPMLVTEDAKVPPAVSAMRTVSPAKNGAVVETPKDGRPGAVAAGQRREVLWAELPRIASVPSIFK